MAQNNNAMDVWEEIQTAQAAQEQRERMLGYQLISLNLADQAPADLMTGEFMAAAHASHTAMN